MNSIHGSSDAVVDGAIGRVPNLEEMKSTFLSALKSLDRSDDETKNCEDLMVAMKSKHGGRWACFGQPSGTEKVSWADSIVNLWGSTSDWDWELYLVSMAQGGAPVPSVVTPIESVTAPLPFSVESVETTEATPTGSDEKPGFIKRVVNYFTN